MPLSSMGLAWIPYYLNCLIQLLLRVLNCDNFMEKSLFLSSASVTRVQLKSFECSTPSHNRSLWHALQAVSPSPVNTMITIMPRFSISQLCRTLYVWGLAGPTVKFTSLIWILFLNRQNFRLMELLCNLVPALKFDGSIILERWWSN